MVWRSPGEQTPATVALLVGSSCCLPPADSLALQLVGEEWCRAGVPTISHHPARTKETEDIHAHLPHPPRRRWSEKSGGGPSPAAAAQVQAQQKMQALAEATGTPAAPRPAPFRQDGFTWGEAQDDR